MGISPRHVRPPRPVGPMPVPSAIALPQPPQAVAQRLFHMAIRPAHVREISGASPPACQLPQLRSVDDPAYLLGREIQLKFSPRPEQIGRAPCRERECQYVKISVVGVSLKKKTKVEYDQDQYMKREIYKKS